MVGRRSHALKVHRINMKRLLYCRQKMQFSVSLTWAKCLWCCTLHNNGVIFEFSFFLLYVFWHYPFARHHSSSLIDILNTNKCRPFLVSFLAVIPNRKSLLMPDMTFRIFGLFCKWTYVSAIFATSRRKGARPKLTIFYQ